MAVKIKPSTGKKIIWGTAIVTTGIALTLAGRWVYQQLKKMEDYDLDFEKLVVKDFNRNKIVMDLFMKFTNRSNLSVTLAKQEYDVYANGIFLTTVKNESPNTIRANSTSSIGAPIVINPSEILAKGILNPLELFTTPKKLNIKIVMKYKVRILFFNVPIPEILYEDTLYNIMA